MNFNALRHASIIPVIHYQAGARAGEHGRPNARNGLFDVWICEHVVGCWPGILAQEIFECEFRWKRGLLPIFIRSMREEMELMGHAVECCVAQANGENLDAYEVVEAFALTDRGSSYHKKGLFVGKTIHQVKFMLEERRGAAARWVKRHQGTIDYYRAKHGK